MAVLLGTSGLMEPTALGARNRWAIVSSLSSSAMRRLSWFAPALPPYLGAITRGPFVGRINRVYPTPASRILNVYATVPSGASASIPAVSAPKAPRAFD